MSASLYFPTIIGTLLGFLIVTLPMTHAQTYTNEYQVKATFLYNLTRMVEWPGDTKETKTTFNICFYGNDSFGDSVELIRHKQIKKREIALLKNITLKMVTQCQMLFIDKSEFSRLAQILSIVKRLPILTVGDVETFAQQGGIINLLKSGEKINLEINLRVAKQSGFVISARLLTLAKIVAE